MQWYLLVLASLGVWRLTHLLNAEDGPWAILARLRAVAGDGAWGELLDCFHCLSLCISVPFALALGVGWGQTLLLWPALSAAAPSHAAAGDARTPAAHRTTAAATL